MPEGEAGYRTPIAFTGQTDTHLPQPVQFAVTICGRLWCIVVIALYSHALLQDMQMISCHAIQLLRFNTNVPMRGVALFPVSISIGQASTQAPQKVQPLDVKSR